MFLEHTRPKYVHILPIMHYIHVFLQWSEAPILEQGGLDLNYTSVIF